MQADDGNFSGDVGGENIAARATLGIGDARIRWLVGDPSVVGLVAPVGSLALRVDAPYGLFQKTGPGNTDWTAIGGGGGGGGGNPQASATALVDFFTLEGAADESAGGGTSQIVTGTTIGGVPMLGVEQLAVSAAGDQAAVVLGMPIADAKWIIDDQTAAGKLVCNIQLHTNDPQTDPVNQTTLHMGTSFSGIFPQFSASSSLHGNANWWVLTNGGEGFVDTGVAVDTTTPHLFTITLDPAGPLTTFAIDNVVVHTVAFVDSGRQLQPWVEVTSDNAAGSNTVSVDWIQWTTSGARVP
jgi:hypothetical protein